MDETKISPHTKIVAGDKTDILSASSQVKSRVGELAERKIFWSPLEECSSK